MIDEFTSVTFDWETMTVDENGYDKNYDYPDKERNEMDDRFVSEVSGRVASNLCTVELDDLNERPGWN